MGAPTLQQAIDAAGSPIDLLWKPGHPPWKPPVVDDEYAGFAAEQRAWRETVALSDLSFHMWDTWVEGPDATRLLSEVSANDYERFAIDQAKQFVPVTRRGFILTDGIIYREAEHRYVVTGPPAGQNWVRFHGETGGYDVSVEVDPDSRVRPEGVPPRVYRYQVQGPLALQVVERAFGAPIPETKFFHATPVKLGDATVRALRHGMAGQAGYEFIGPWADAAKVKEALLRAGEEFGIVHVGALAYATNGIESGWIPSPTAAVYTDEDLRPYREWLSVFSYEGMNPLNGSFYSRNIEDYYLTPYDLGYGRSLSLDHDFIGRDALVEHQAAPRKHKVTLEVDREAVDRVLGAEHGYVLRYGRLRVEQDGRLVGTSYYTGYIDPVGTVLGLALLDESAATPGTRVEIVWGDHPGGDVPADADLGLPRLSATVQPSPYNEWARENYRRAIA